MYLQKIKSAIIGRVHFKAEGYYIEKFINICRAKGFYLGNLQRKKNTAIEADIPVSDFRDICKIARANNCKIKIMEKKGIPFILNKYRKRKIFVISLLVLLVALVIMSKFVWNIEVIGNVEIASNEILEIAKNDGLEIGKLKSKINIKEIVENIRLEREDVSWVRN